GRQVSYLSPPAGRGRQSAMRRDAQSPVAFAYASLFGLIGWAVLLLALFWPHAAGAPTAVAPPAALFGVFVVVIVLARLMAFGVTFILLHYLLQAARLWLRGLAVGPLLREWIRPGIVGELALLPLAVILIDVYQPTDPTPFLLLSVTYLIINLVVKLLSDTSA